jgi:hypothetical protein
MLLHELVLCKGMLLLVLMLLLLLMKKLHVGVVVLRMALG